MPKWVRCFFIEFLPIVLFMKRPADMLTEKESGGGSMVVKRVQEFPVAYDQQVRVLFFDSILMISYNFVSNLQEWAMDKTRQKKYVVLCC